MSRATLNFPSIGLSDFFNRDSEELFFCSDTLGTNEQLKMYLKTDLFDDLIKKQYVGVVFIYSSSVTPRVFMERDWVITQRDRETGEVTISKADKSSIFSNIQFPENADFDNGDCTVQLVANQTCELLCVGNDIDEEFTNIKFSYPEGAILAQIEYSQKRDTFNVPISFLKTEGNHFRYNVDASSMQIYVPTSVYQIVVNQPNSTLGPLCINVLTKAFLFCRISEREGIHGTLINQLKTYLDGTDDGSDFLSEELEADELFEYANKYAQEYFDFVQVDFFKNIGVLNED